MMWQRRKRLRVTRGAIMTRRGTTTINRLASSLSSLSLSHPSQTRLKMDNQDLPNPFSSSPSPSGSGTPVRATSPSSSDSTTNPNVPAPVPEFPRKPSSLISAASGSPPPTHRASFPDPSKEPKKGSSKLAGPPTKTDFCCERDREIARGEEISIIDAYKTTEGGTTSYITYVIRLGVSTSLP